MSRVHKSIQKLVTDFQRYHFELKHLLVILVVLIFFLTSVSLLNKISIQELLFKTQNWYQQDSAERLANLTATSLELLLESSLDAPITNPEDEEKMVTSLNIILNQQRLQQHVLSVCLLVPIGDSIYAIDDGRDILNYFHFHRYPPQNKTEYLSAIKLYKEHILKEHTDSEYIISIKEDEKTFHVFVPFVPKGEYLGAVYMKNIPDFSFITREIIVSYDETAFIFAALIILGLLAMFYISSYTVKERDEAQMALFEQKEQYLREKIDREKEELFTKRIYHTHHKAEKVMGFIKEDLSLLDQNNVDEIRNRVLKYANFISRVIYDMKWYDPPLHTIRNPIFRTNINDVIRFITENIFLRTSRGVQADFELKLDENLPAVPINEFVIWEILEPLIQNCIEHSGRDIPKIFIKTEYDEQRHEGTIVIEDNGVGIRPDLLQTEGDRKRIFMEHQSTKPEKQNAGYGCFIAYEIARKRCGWSIDASNRDEGGARFVLKFKSM